jgi:hypothetical protein
MAVGEGEVARQGHIASWKMRWAGMGHGAWAHIRHHQVAACTLVPATVALTQLQRAGDGEDPQLQKYVVEYQQQQACTGGWLGVEPWQRRLLAGQVAAAPPLPHLCIPLKRKLTNVIQPQECVGEVCSGACAPHLPYLRDHHPHKDGACGAHTSSQCVGVACPVRV